MIIIPLSVAFLNRQIILFQPCLILVHVAGCHVTSLDLFLFLACCNPTCTLVRDTVKRARETRRDSRTKTTAAQTCAITCPTISRPILIKIERNHSHSKHNFEGYILNNNLWPKVGGEAHPSPCLFFIKKIQTLAHVLVSQICANLISPLFLVNSFARILITCHVI